MNIVRYTLVLLTIVIGFTSAVLLSVATAQAQYQLVELKHEETQLRQSVEAQKLYLDEITAPAQLAQRAEELGLVQIETWEDTVDISSRPQ